MKQYCHLTKLNSQIKTSIHDNSSELKRDAGLRGNACSFSSQYMNLGKLEFGNINSSIISKSFTTRKSVGLSRISFGPSSHKKPFSTIYNNAQM